MLLWDILFAAGIAVVFSALLRVARGRMEPRGGIFVLFSLVFLAAWAAGVWFRPVGPVLNGVYWLPALLAGLVASIALAFRESLKHGAGSRSGAGRARKRPALIAAVAAAALLAVVTMGYLL